MERGVGMWTWGCGEDHLGPLRPGYNAPQVQSNHKSGSTFLFPPGFPRLAGSCICWPGSEISLLEASGDTSQW